MRGMAPMSGGYDRPWISPGFLCARGAAGLFRRVFRGIEPPGVTGDRLGTGPPCGALTVNRRGRLSPALLDHMRQFMSQELPPAGPVGPVLPPREYDMTAARIGQGRHRIRRLCRLVVVMHPDLPEVISEPWLEECSGCAIQRTTRRREHLPHDRGGRPRACSMKTVHPASHDRRRLTLLSLCRRLRVRHAHHLGCHSVGFLFELILRVADDEFLL